jgi:formylglycine-generating enzyme required for sulfatase activity
MLAEFIQLPKDGETIGPYLIRNTLATSVLGNLCMATHKERHVDLLIHIIPDALLRADPRFHQRYREAIEAQRQMPAGHALAAVLLTRVSGNLVVEYPPGKYRSLNEWILKRREPVGSDQARSLLRGIADGLADAQKVGQGHFFLTPDFLLINEENEVRIAGIGLFQSIHYEAFERFISGAIVPVQIDKDKRFNAIEILSPEIRNQKVRDARGDFYCVGMCAYFILTGLKPERRWILPSKVRPDLHSGWDLFISHCLEPRPADRFPHYRAFVRDLGQIDSLAKGPRTEDGRLLRILHQIPLPQALEQLLGGRFLLAARLILLGLAGVLAVGTASLFYQIIFADMDEGGQSPPMLLVQEPEKANLILRVQPPNALIKISGPQSGRFLVTDGRLLLRGRKGRYQIEASSPRRQSARFELQIRSDDPVSRDVRLDYRFVTLQVGAAPGTEIYAETRPGLELHLGTVGPEGLLEVADRLLAGEYPVVGRHPAFLTARSEAVKLADRPASIELVQEARPTGLRIQSVPEGAQVYAGAVMLGRTPLRHAGLEPGVPHELRIEKAGYRSVQRTITLDPGQQLGLDLGELEPRIGTLVYQLPGLFETLTSPEAFSLTIDGRPVAFAPGAALPLSEGSHQLRLEHPDYFPFEVTVDIRDTLRSEVNLVAQPRPTRLRPSYAAGMEVRFRVGDAPAQLTEDGVLPIPPNQPVRVEAIIPDHHNVIQWFEGTANSVIDWEIPLKRLPSPEQGVDYITPYVGIELVWVEPARFNMGSPVEEFRRIPNEDNLTTVRLDYGYWIGRHELGQAAFAQLTGTNPSRFRDAGHPVDSVSWDAAMEFCQLLTERERRAGRLPEGYVYRLPTEAEWELAARAGTGTPFSFGDTADPSKGNFQGWYAPGESTGRAAEERYGTLPVGSFPPNAWGLFDVHGNVAEWALDRYWDRHPGGAVTNPFNDGRGRGHTLRGGSWRDSADRVRSAAREGAPTDSVRNSIGLRVVLAPEMPVNPTR